VKNTGTKYVRIIKQTAFGREKTKSIKNVLNIQYLYLLNKDIKCNFRGRQCGTATVVVVRHQRVKGLSEIICKISTSRSYAFIDKRLRVFRCFEVTVVHTLTVDRKTDGSETFCPQV
jgi:hypothetical protein